MALTESQRKYIEQTYQVKSPVVSAGATYDPAQDIARLRSMRDSRKGFLETVGDKAKERVSKLAEGYMSGQNPVSSGLQTVGAGAGMVGDVLFEGAKRITPEFIKKPIREGMQVVGEQPVVQDVMTKMSEWAEQHPEAAANLESIVDIASLFPAGKGGQVLKEGTEAGVKTIQAGVKSGKDILQKGKEVLQTGVEKAGQAVNKVEDVFKPMAEDLKRFPERAAINTAEKKAIEQSISKLPSKTAQIAVRDGIDINDVKSIYQIPVEQKSQLKELWETAKQYELSGKKTTDPIEVVGRPITQRLKELESARTEVGKKLGEVSKELGIVTREELFPTVFGRLKSVPGLEELTVDSKGVLNFKNTVLTTKETAADRVQS